MATSSKRYGFFDSHPGVCFAPFAAAVAFLAYENLATLATARTSVGRALAGVGLHRGPLRAGGPGLVRRPRPRGQASPRHDRPGHPHRDRVAHL